MSERWTGKKRGFTSNIPAGIGSLSYKRWLHEQLGGLPVTKMSQVEPDGSVAIIKGHGMYEKVIYTAAPVSAAIPGGVYLLISYYVSLETIKIHVLSLLSDRYVIAGSCSITIPSGIPANYGLAWNRVFNAVVLMLPQESSVEFHLFRLFSGDEVSAVTVSDTGSVLQSRYDYIDGNGAGHDQVFDYFEKEGISDKAIDSQFNLVASHGTAPRTAFTLVEDGKIAYATVEDQGGIEVYAIYADGNRFAVSAEVLHLEYKANRLLYIVREYADNGNITQDELRLAADWKRPDAYTVLFRPPKSSWEGRTSQTNYTYGGPVAWDRVDRVEGSLLVEYRRVKFLDPDVEVYAGDWDRKSYEFDGTGYLIPYATASYPQVTVTSTPPHYETFTVWGTFGWVYDEQHPAGHMVYLNPKEITIWINYTTYGSSWDWTLTDAKYAFFWKIPQTVSSSIQHSQSGEIKGGNSFCHFTRDGKTVICMAGQNHLLYHAELHNVAVDVTTTVDAVTDSPCRIAVFNQTGSLLYDISVPAILTEEVESYAKYGNYRIPDTEFPVKMTEMIMQ